MKQRNAYKRRSRRSRLSAHLALEVAASRWRGQPLDRGEPVPGCSCWRCTGLAPKARCPADQSAIRCPGCGALRDLVRGRSTVWYQCLVCGTRSAREWPHETAGSLLDRLPRVLEAWRIPGRESEPAGDVDRARAVPITEVARRLGLEVGRRSYARCPFHDDRHPSLHLNDRKRAAFCNPCGKSWDAIALVMAVRRIPFREAVRELTRA